MPNPMEKAIKEELNSLIKSGSAILKSFSKNDSVTDSLKRDFDYQKFYTVSSELLRQVIPSRYDEYRQLYRNEKRKAISVEAYSISDYLAGLSVTRMGKDVFDITSVARQRLISQLSILQSIYQSLDSLLVDLTTVVAADLFDSEIEMARTLIKSKHLRASGALAGVILEKHLASVIFSNSITLSKKNPSISDYIEALKTSGKIDTVQWRGLQRLADIRNLSAHSKGREPTVDEINELVDGVDRVMKTIL